MTSGSRQRACQWWVLVGHGAWAGCFGSDHPVDEKGSQDAATAYEGDAAVVAQPARECAIVCARLGEDPDGEPFPYFLSLQEMIDGDFRLDCTSGSSAGTSAVAFTGPLDPTADECLSLRAHGCGGSNDMRPDGGPMLERAFLYSFGKDGIDVVVTIATLDDSEEPRTIAFTIPFEECRAPHNRFAPDPSEAHPEFR
jgi:hypothetical protein